MTQLALPGGNPLRVEPMPKGWTPDEPPSLAGVDEVGFDVETTGLRWWRGDRPIGICVAWDEGREARYLPFGHAGGNLDRTRVLEWMLTELRGKRLVGLNIKFDAHHSREMGVDLEALGCSLGDVGHYAALLDDHRRRFSLEAIGQDFVGEGKVDGLIKSRMADYPAWQVTPYGRQDAALVLKIQAAQRPLLAAQDLERVAALEDEVLWPVLEMEKNASPIDVERLRAWVSETEEEKLLADLRVTKLAGYPVNPDKDSDLERLFSDRKIDISHRTPTGRPSFSRDVLIEAAKTDEVIERVLVSERLGALRSKFLLPYDRAVGDDGLLRYSLNQLLCETPISIDPRSMEVLNLDREGSLSGTVSGRFSSSQPIRGEGFNIQQVMSVAKQKRVYGDDYLIRSLHVPRSGLFLSADAKQIEFRVFASMSKSPRLLKAYADNPETDHHAIVGALVAEYRPDFDRKQIKNLNFAKIFGAGVRRMAGMLDVTEEKAVDLNETYDAAFPEARILMRKATRIAETRGYVKTVLGRRARFPDKVRTFTALNRVIQGSAADECKVKAVALHKARRETGFTMRATIHDEFIGDVPDQESARRVKAVLEEQILKFDVPILWDVCLGSSWASAV